MESQSKNELKEGHFFSYLDSWYSNLSSLPLDQAIRDPGRTAIMAIDVTNGFCKEGPLASQRVNEIVKPIVHLFKRSWKVGVRNFVLSQDTHEADALEFEQWPVHCVRGSKESATVPEIQSLPFYNSMVVIPKNSINPALRSGFPDWMALHSHLDTFIAVGDCTDLCTYQLAMYIKLDANASQIKRRVIVPADCVNTYDLSVEQAKPLGVLPHPADLIHKLFLYHMALNGIEVCRSIE